MTVTGHKSEQSLKNYTGYTDVNIKRHMSHTISRGIGLNIDDEPSKQVNKKRKHDENASKGENVADQDELVYGNFDLNVDLEPLPLSNSQMDTIISECDFSDDDFNVLASQLPLDNLRVQNVVANQVANQVNVNQNTCTSTLNYTGIPFPRFPGPVITGSHAQVTINYNIFPGK